MPSPPPAAPRSAPTNNLPHPRKRDELVAACTRETSKITLLLWSKLFKRNLPTRLIDHNGLLPASVRYRQLWKRSRRFGFVLGTSATPLKANALQLAWGHIKDRVKTRPWWTGLTVGITLLLTAISR